MFGKIFDSIYDGTLGEDWRALITFMQLIILADKDGIVDMTPAAISRRTGIPIEHIKAGIEILESDDPHSRTSDHNGKRIIRLDDERPWGWYIVNHQKYREIRSEEDRKEYMRNYMREKREKEKSEENQQSCKQQKSTKANSKKSLAKLANTDTDTDTDLNTLEAFNTFWRHYPKKKSKGQARKQWLKLCPDKPLIEKILQAIDIAKESDDWQKDNGKYIPYPASWLNAEGWENEQGSDDSDLFGGAL